MPPAAVTRDDAWWRIRALRSGPPGHAADDPERRAVFSAALQQSEELFAAAAAVSPAARPLPLFYAVSQAGRAIAAAYNSSPGWRITSHGLTVRTATSDLPSTRIEPNPRRDGSDAYGSVARALGSQTLDGAVTLADLWAAIPELAAFPHLQAGALTALEIRPEGQNPNLLPALHPAVGTVLVLHAGGDQSLKARLALYANTEGCVILAGPLPTVDGVSQITLHWPTEPSRDATPGTKAFRGLHEVATRIGDRWYLQPLLGTPPRAPKPLLVRWALLIALSSVARYHPGTWTAALDVDAVPTGVELEEGLPIAQQRLPQLIASALEPPHRIPPLRPRT